MTAAQEQAKKETLAVIEKMPSGWREIARDTLLPNNAIHVRGKEIYIDLSEDFSLPENTTDRTYVVNKSFSVVALSKTPLVSGSVAGQQMKAYSQSTLICLSNYRCTGELEGYTMNIEGHVIDRYLPPVEHHIFGTQAARRVEFRRWNILDGAVPINENFYFSLSPLSDPQGYIFVMFSHLDSTNKMFKQITGKTKANQGILTHDDFNAKKAGRVELQEMAFEAGVWLKHLTASQLQVLKSKFRTDMPNGTDELAHAAVKESIYAAFLNLVGIYPEQILKYKEEIGNIEIPEEALAKGYLADAIRTNVLLFDETHGLLVTSDYEASFEGVIQRTKLDHSRQAMVFHERVTPTRSADFISANENLASIKKLKDLVEINRMKYGKNDPKLIKPTKEYRSLCDANGMFATK